MRRVFPRPELERRIQERLETRLSARYERVIRRELRAAADEAAQAFRETGDLSEAVMIHEARIQSAITSMYRDAYLMVGGRVGEALERFKGYQPAERKQFQMSDAFRFGLESFIRQWAARKVTGITQTTIAQFADIVERGIAEGLTLDDVAGLISSRGREMSAYRAHAIARTETHAAANAGALNAAQESGVVSLKEWIPVDDGRTRTLDNSDFDHVNVDSVPINQPFDVSGDLLMYPGDPNGSPGNVIMCRCAMGYIVE